MRTRIAFAAVALCLTATTPAAASTAVSESSLVITVYDTLDPLRPVVREVTLKCGPTGGSHPDAEGACATLTQVDGDFDALLQLGLYCPEYYQPVLVEV